MADLARVVADNATACPVVAVALLALALFVVWRTRLYLLMKGADGEPPFAAAVARGRLVPKGGCSEGPAVNADDDNDDEVGGEMIRLFVLSV